MAQVNKYKNQLQSVYDYLLKLYPPPAQAKPIEEIKLLPKPNPIHLEESKNLSQPESSPSMSRMSTFLKKRVQKLEPLVSQLKVHLTDPKKREALLKLFENADEQAIQADVMVHTLEAWGVKMSEQEVL